MDEAERERRSRYEAEVRALAGVANEQRASGRGEEEIARELVERRNDLKLGFRAHDDPEQVAAMERRNLAKYGDPVGPGADWFFARHGSWTAVIAAACRPADLSKDKGGRI